MLKKTIGRHRALLQVRSTHTPALAVSLKSRRPYSARTQIVPLLLPPLIAALCAISGSAAALFCVTTPLVCHTYCSQRDGVDNPFVALEYGSGFGPLSLALASAFPAATVFSVDGEVSSAVNAGKAKLPLLAQVRRGSQGLLLRLSNPAAPPSLKPISSRGLRCTCI